MSEIKLTIDGMTVKSQPGLSLLLAAREQGIDIPTLCYHDDLKPEGHCRLCVVEIGAPPHTRLVNSCTYPVEPGLTVQTRSEKALAARRMVLELLLAQAPAAELIRQMAAEMGVFETRFKPGEPDARCILCAQCVRTCREVVGVSAISMAFRTPGKVVATPFGEESEACIGCGSCVFVCPTSVIEYTEKDGVRTVWGRQFELQACTSCGNYIAPKAQLEHWAKLTGDPVASFFVCKDCR
jgi:bidirectional [NiFe] hydrogenase diaphorase subunit